MPKLIGFWRKHILIFLQNLKAIGAVSIELSRKQKSTTYTHKHTHIHTFSADDFFFNVDDIYTKKVEIWQLIFDPDSRLYPIKDLESEIA